MADLLQAIMEERRRRDEKWGEQDHRDTVWMAILTEEVGEAAKAILEQNPIGLDKEIVQIAAVALAWAEARQRHAVCHCDLCA